MRKKILLVEDSAILREGINNMLSSSGKAEIDDFAVSQQDAISLLEHKQYDLMIVDIELAEGNGFEVVKHTLSDAYPHEPPVFVMLTNNAFKYYRDFARSLGIKYFFDKSMEFDLAIEKIEALASQQSE